MRSKFGAIVVSGSGKIGGQAFSESGKRPKLSAIGQRTVKQRYAPNTLLTTSRSLIGMWKQLTQSQRGTWQGAIRGTSSAFNAFVSLNVNRRKSGNAIINEFINSAARYTLTSFSIAADASAHTITVSSAQTVLGTPRCHLSLSAQQSPGKSVNSKGIRLFTLGSAQANFGYNLGSAYEAVYGALIAGKKIFYEAYVYNAANGEELLRFNGSFYVSP